MIVKLLIFSYVFLSACVVCSQGNWHEDFRPDEDFEFHRIDTAFWGEEVESIKYINENNGVVFYVKNPQYEEFIETAYLSNGLHIGLWRRYNDNGVLIRSLDFDTLTIQAEDILQIAEANEFDLENYKIGFLFEEDWDEHVLKHHWTIAREYSEHVNSWSISGISVNAVTGKKSDYGIQIHEQPVLPDYHTPPYFNGLYKLLEEFIAENSRFPISSKPKSENAVLVSFKVGADGTLRDISTGKANTGSFKREARRLVEIMPDWIPAKRYGEPVECSYHVIFINFE